MNIAIDISPLKSGNYLQHRVRGTGFYLEHLRGSLQKYYPNNAYQFFSRGESLHTRPDVIHYPYFEPFFLTLPFIKKYKTVVTVHDLTPLVFPKEFPRGIKGNIKWQIQKHALHSADAIITDSKISKDDIVRYGGISQDKVQVVYLAAGEEFRKIQDTRYKIQVRKKYNLPEKFALYVGDATWNKNLPRLVTAAIEAKIPLVMIGKAILEENFDKTNPWNKDLVKVQELAKNNQLIIRPGFVSTEELVAIYNVASLFVMPSFYEGFGLPLLEAMSCGCPVVTSREGSIPEGVGNAALFVDAYSKEDIAKGMSTVFNNKTLQQELIQKGLEQVKKFSWEKTAAETMHVYQEVVSSS